MKKGLLVSTVAVCGVVAAMAAIPVFEEGQEQTCCRGVPVKSYGGTYVYCGAPDLVEGASFQQGNGSPLERIKPKPSQELESNYFGVNTTRMPCLEENQERCEEAVHLIDGDLQTCWLSGAQVRCDMQPVVVWIDLAREVEVSKVVLRKRSLSPETQRRKTDRHPAADACEVGRGLPAAMSVSLSCDAWRWRDVFGGEVEAKDGDESF